MASSLRPISSSLRSSLLPAARGVAAQVPLATSSVSRVSTQWRRTFQADSKPPASSSSDSRSQTHGGVPDYAFAFDIDGVLLRSSAPLPGASQALKYLQSERIPFILLTNGGGKSEEERVADLQNKLNVELDTSMIVQSHTPFAEMKHLHDKTVLVAGGDYNKCQQVAQKYGFKNVVTPGDIVAAYPDIWPFAKVFMEYYKSFAKPLPKPIIPHSTGPEALKIDAIFVYNDPRDWGLDSAVILDTLLSSKGYIGTLSGRNGDESLPNRGYLQDGQPHLYYSNPDMWWATSYHLSRLGQGGFAAAFAGLWNSVTNGSTLSSTTIGKPRQPTYAFAEKRLRAHRKALFGQTGLRDPLRNVYMVGDNPESDIAGANSYESEFGSKWTSILVKTGVWREGTEPAHKPDVVRENVLDAVRCAVEDARGREDLSTRRKV